MLAIIDMMEFGETEYLSLMLEHANPASLDILIHISYMKGSKTLILDLLWYRGASIKLSRAEILNLFEGSRTRVPSFPITCQTLRRFQVYKRP
jgi:hypothetical protein